MSRRLKSLIIGTASAAALITAADATDFNIPAGDLKGALGAYMAQSGVTLLVSGETLKGAQTRGVSGSLSADTALSKLLSGTGFTAHKDSSGLVGIVRDRSSQNSHDVALDMVLAQAAPSRAAVETVTVTSSKLGGADVQSIPIAITALSQEQLTATQTAGGPDLVKQVPNLTFTKTNFTGYSIQIRGIGTQAISVATDPAVAVALNDIPFIRNHFFEQEFYDLGQAEVLRGPQGTLYGRNATAGVVNLVTAKPADQFEASVSADIGNYENRRFEGMVNLPIVDDRLDLRLAGEWTQRKGYTLNELTGDQVDGRDLWSGRLTIGWKPLSNLQTYLVWEHFSENDDRMRTAKQLCKTDPGRSSINGVPVDSDAARTSGIDTAFTITQSKFSQGCLPTSLYSSDAFEVPNGYSLPYVTAGYVSGGMRTQIDPYASTTQSTDLRVIETQINPKYRSKNDTVEFNADYAFSPSLTLSSQTGYNQDALWSTEDYNRFNTTPDIFLAQPDSQFLRVRTLVNPDGNYLCNDGSISTGAQCVNQGSTPTGYFCDPQLGCSTRLVAQDVSREHAWQFSQEFRVASSFSGPLNFSFGGNYMHYETVEDYYVFSNALTLFAATSGIGSSGSAWMSGVTDNHECFTRTSASFNGISGSPGYQYNNPNGGAGQPTSTCYAIDTSPLEQVDDAGHNYFLSRNPYVLNSYAGFGEAYYDLFSDLKLTGGLRWTDDQKHFIDIPSELLANGIGYASTGIVDQEWTKVTGRFAANWTPKLDFTDQTLGYASYAHGYKAGGANPPGAVLAGYGVAVPGVPIHPLTFAPEYIDAYELGTKNTLLDGSVTLNGDVFYYNYKGYQISEIVDRTSVNLNFDATVRGAEIEATYEPVPGLRFKFAGGYEHTRLADGSQAIDLMDRTAGHTDWVLMKPFVQESSNCILPSYVAAALVVRYEDNGEGNPGVSACDFAYQAHKDPVTQGVYGTSWAGTADPSRNLVPGQPYYTLYDSFGNIQAQAGYPIAVSHAGLPTQIYPGFDPSTAPNNGEGFAKNLSGNELPNAPQFTVSASADYTVPLTPEWAGTAHIDYYWQDYSWARVFNDNPYDRLRGYTNVNLALILTSQEGWQVMGYMKNIFNTTAITGAFLNSDDSGLTTNVFLTDPRLFGVRVTKNW